MSGGNSAINDDFAGDGALLGYTTHNASALPSVQRTAGRYRALLEDNTTNQTLWYHLLRGRGDFKLLSFPFDVVARNVGIGTTGDSQAPVPDGQNAVIFAGLAVHHDDLQSDNWSFIVAGHKGGFDRTVEGKNTVDGVSTVTDEGNEAITGTRVDLRIVGDVSGNLTAYWQEPGTSPDNWIPYRGAEGLPNPQPVYGAQVYVGLITYASWSNNALPVVGTCDSLEDYS